MILGTHTGYTYEGDPRYRVSGIGHYNGQTPLGSISYPTRDGSGNPLSVVDNTGQATYDSWVFRASYFGFRVSHPGGYYHFDALGSTRLLTDGSGSVTDEYSYDAWGNVTSHTGSTDQPYQFVGRLGYYTHWQDPNLDLLQLGVRFYDPESGRFTQRDMADASFNAYEYADGQPIYGVDPTGLYTEDGSCSKDCPQLAGWIDEINKALKNKKCQDALKRNGIDACVKPNLAGLQIKCGNCGGNAGYTNPVSGVIHLDCRKGFAQNRTPLHEAVHSCRMKCGLFGPDQKGGCWTCSCGRKWGTPKKPYPYIHEEKIAEEVVHQCGF